MPVTLTNTLTSQRWLLPDGASPGPVVLTDYSRGLYDIANGSGAALMVRYDSGLTTTVPAGATYSISNNGDLFSWGEAERNGAVWPGPTATRGSKDTKAGMRIYYVNALIGSDTASGSFSTPFKTISRASEIVVAGDTVRVAAGVYHESVVTAASGTEVAPITFIADPMGVVLKPGPTGDTGWWVKGNYTILDGFTVDGDDGETWNVGIYASGSYDKITNSIVRNIAIGPINDANGAAGILGDSFYGGSHTTVSNCTVHHVGKDSLDQGIYISNAFSQVINNTVHNVFSVGIHLWHNATNVLIQNNIVHHCGSGILVGGGDFYSGWTGPDDYTNVINNTIHDCDYGIAEQGVTGTHNTYVGNLLYNIVNEQYRLQHGNTFTPGDGATP